MKYSQLKSVLFLFAISITASLFAQDFQGKAYYQTKTTIDMEAMTGGRQIPPDRLKQMQERMKSFLEKQYTLTFNREESIYKEEEKLEAQGGRGGWGGFASSMTGGPKYKNVKEKEILQDNEFFGKQFLVKDELKPIEWKMGSETKQIGQYTVFKATAVVPDNSFDPGMFRRRGGDEEKKDEDEAPKTVEITAWYTMQIPVNQGPSDYWGLPGLILEVHEGRTTILCTKIVLNSKDKDTIDKPTKGDVVTQEEYKDITTKKMQEMRENFRGRGRGGRRN